MTERAYWVAELFDDKRHTWLPVSMLTTDRAEADRMAETWRHLREARVSRVVISDAPAEPKREPMTLAWVRSIVEPWPEGAKPEGLQFPYDTSFVYEGSVYACTPPGIKLLAARCAMSGLKYLKSLSSDWHAALLINHAGNYYVSMGDQYKEHTTELEAINAAIVATGGVRA